MLDDNYFMREALKEAQKAFDAGEVPVGAVLVCQDRIIARGHNQTELLHDATAHAEMLALTGGQSYIGSRYLNDCKLYVTLEPCPMCSGALSWTQIGEVIYAAQDDKRGYTLYQPPLLHPKTKVKYGIMEAEASALLKAFFKAKR